MSKKKFTADYYNIKAFLLSLDFFGVGGGKNLSELRAWWD